LTCDETQAARIRDLRVVAFDFDGVLTDNAVWIAESGEESVRCSRLDGIGLAALRGLGLALAVVSTETSPVVGARCRKLGLDCVQACTDKAAALRELLRRAGAAPEQAAFVGNDVNDLPALELVGVPVVVADAHPALDRPGFLRTTRAGGHGAVREFCDLVVAIRERVGRHA
jgi:YrbI family 3-deoxy-D-manno-octulosonate 8-phosphate phosphatase